MNFYTTNIYFIVRYTFCGITRNRHFKTIKNALNFFEGIAQDELYTKIELIKVFKTEDEVGTITDIYEERLK